ncbi:hypothetical protein ASG87_11495 [Frateuria sp. Soil773]|uniref:hypothetical protein n=1 Tax=Frateuria sp. Soil773 TaxID=1736407 RepID=UPI0007023B00|nr:hypothetical protein [Frateuria sp. Soil773]KRF02099.1 hypothetical protein ASG87_11495 [Frateuria sp. Soil773]
MKRFPRIAILSSLIASAVLLGACGKHDNEPAPAAAPPAAGTAAPAPVPSATAPAPATTAPAPAPAASAAPASSGTSATAPAPDGAFRIDGVELGDAVGASHKISKAKTVFAPTGKAIYASVATSGKTDGATLAARWTYLEGQGQQVSTISQSIATDGPATTTFKVQNPNPWPAGKYKVEISLDGKPVTSRTFEVKAS